MRTETPYDDEYPTCACTFAWLRVMSEHLQPDLVTSSLGLEPTRTQRRGDVRSPRSARTHAYSGWFLESAAHVDSRDARRHLDWLLVQLQGASVAIQALKAQGHLVDICIRWDSAHAHGGRPLIPRTWRGSVRWASNCGSTCISRALTAMSNGVLVTAPQEPRRH